MKQSYVTGLLLSISLLAGPARLWAQVVPPPLPTWRAEIPSSTDARNQRWASGTASLVPAANGVDTRSHARTGLLIGGLVGAAATAIFLVGFCDDPDTKCDADEVGRAVVLIALPTAAAGALIGALIRTKR
jgi:hypothetical protein